MNKVVRSALQEIVAGRGCQQQEPTPTVGTIEAALIDGLVELQSKGSVRAHRLTAWTLELTT